MKPPRDEGAVTMAKEDAGEYVVRFSFWSRFQHAAVILLLDRKSVV